MKDKKTAQEKRIIEKIRNTRKRHKEIEEELSRQYPKEYEAALLMDICEKLEEIGERGRKEKRKKEIYAAAPGELKQIKKIKSARARAKKKDELISKLLTA